MTKSAEAWFRKPKRITHNQQLIQIVLTTAFIAPIPIAAICMWLIAHSPPIFIQTAFFSWLIADATYLGLMSYVRMKTREV